VVFGAGLEGDERNEQVRGSKRESRPFEFVGIPMLGGEGTGAFVPVGNRLATGLACDASGLEILGRGGAITMWAIAFL
jgi:hypothetical protein